MRFEDFLKTGLVRKASPDRNLARSLVIETKQDIAFFDSLVINEKSARKIVSNYYDFLRSILEAIAVIDGYKIYGHEVYSFYLKDKGEDMLAEKFSRFREIRNRINYYGRSISAEEASDLVNEMKVVLDKLTEKYLRDVI